MKGTRGFPLTGVSSTNMWTIFVKIEMFCPRYLTYEFSKNKNLPNAARKTGVIWMVHQKFGHPLVIYSEIKYLNNIFGLLVTLSIPKRVKNGQKVPVLAMYEINLKNTWVLHIYSSVWSRDNCWCHLNSLWACTLKKTSQKCLKCWKFLDFWAILPTFWPKIEQL